MKFGNTAFGFLDNVDAEPESIYVHHTKIEEQLPIHEHTKHQLSYVEGGVAFLNTPTASYFLPARHFVWIPAGLRHNVELRTSVIIVRNMYFPAHLFPKDHSLRKMGIYPVTNLVLEMILYTHSWRGAITVKQRDKYEFLIALRNVLMAVSRIPLPVELPTTKNIQLQTILKHIHLNIGEPLTLVTIAQTFAMSSRSLSRLFREQMGISFLQYVKLSRVIRGMEMLLETQLSISEIAYSCGYGNIAAFSNVFFQVAHTRPGDFRKQNSS